MNNYISTNELDKYESMLRDSMKEDRYCLYGNETPDNTIIVLKLLCEFTKKSLHIFCGKLNSKVYSALKDDFKKLIDRGVELRVITEKPYPDLEAQDTAKLLLSAGAWRSCGCKQKVSHYAVSDQKRFRLERGAGTCEAIVAPSINPACAADVQAVNSMEGFFTRLWKVSTDKAE